MHCRGCFGFQDILRKGGCKCIGNRVQIAGRLDEHLSSSHKDCFCYWKCYCNCGRVLHRAAVEPIREEKQMHTLDHLMWQKDVTMMVCKQGLQVQRLTG